MTPFRFEHLYRAVNPAAILDSFFAPDLVAEQDRRTGIRRRELIEQVDTPAEVRRISVAYPERQLPGFVRALVGPDLSFEETVVWARGANHLDYDIHPRVLGGRAHIRARYSLTQVGVGQVLRVYEGEATIDVRLVGGRIERHVADDLGKTILVSAGRTQEYLDRKRLT